MICFGPSIVASKVMSAPLASVSFKVMSASTLASVISESSILRAAPSKVIEIFELTTTSIALLSGLNVTLSAVPS